MRKAGVVVIAAVTVACGSRAHLTETHGRSYRAVLAAQTANPASTARAPRGLDSQEATIIAETYRNSLVPEGQEVKQPPVLVLTPQQQGRPQQPAPSVPK